MLLHLRVNTNKTSNDYCYDLPAEVKTDSVEYVLRSLRPCDRLSSPPSVMLLQLRIRRNKMTNGYCYSLPFEVKGNIVESFKKLQAL